MLRRLSAKEDLDLFLYESLTDAMVYEEDGAWIISTPQGSDKYDTTDELMEDVRYNLECIGETVPVEEHKELEA